MKKDVKSFYLILSLILLVSVIGGVFAYDYYPGRYEASGDPYAPGPISSLITNLGDIIEQIFDAFKPVFEIILGKNFYSEGSLAEGAIIRLLFFIIIFSLVWVTTEQMEMISSSSNKAIHWIVVIAVSLLATRWTTYPGGFIETILLPYSAMGIAMTSFLPLIIYFFFVEWGIKNKSLRKIAWIFFAVSFTFLWLVRYEQLLAKSNSPLGLYIYPITIVLSVLFFLFDGTIQRWIAKSHISKIRSGAAKRLARDLEIEIKKIEELMAKETDEKKLHKLRKERQEHFKALTEIKAEENS